MTICASAHETAKQKRLGAAGDLPKRQGFCWRRFVSQEGPFPTRCDLAVFRYAHGEPRESVTPVTAVGDGLCSIVYGREGIMMSTQMYDNLSSALPIDD